MSKERCATPVAEGGGRRWHPCGNKVKMHHEGTGYCGIHDPVRQAKRVAERKAKWDAEVKVDVERDRKLRSWDGLLAACELAIENETCVCGGNKGAPCMHCILTAAVKAAH